MQVTFNFASRTYFNRRALSAGLWVMIAGLCVLLAWNGNFLRRSVHQISRIQDELGEMDQKLQQMRSAPAGEKKPSDPAQVSGHVALVNGILDKDSTRWTGLLGRLEELVPDGVSVRGLRPDFSSGTLHLDGWARGIGDLRELLERLLAEDDFRGVFLLRQAKQGIGKSKKGSDQTLIAFTLVVPGALVHE